MAGLATGTFYNYYSSKDSLFIELYNEENVKLKKSIMESIDLQADPPEVVKELIYLNLQGMTSNSILKEWYNREVFNKIEQSFREENGLEQVDFLYSSFIEIVKNWQNERKMRSDIDAEMIMAIFMAIGVMETHKEEIGFKFFPRLIEYVADFIMKGLMNTSEKNNPDGVIQQ